MSEPIHVVYDGECPFCSQYVKLLRFRDAVGQVDLVNAREADHPVVRRVQEQGIVLDEEMALVMNDRIYVGADCISRLALMTTSSSWFNRLNAVMFASPRIANAAYPILRSGRWLALKMLGREMMGR